MPIDQFPLDDSIELHHGVDLPTNFQFSLHTMDSIEDDPNFPPSSDDVKIVSSKTNEKHDGPKKFPRRTIFSLVILTLINLLNYMDRFTISGVLIPIQKFYTIDDTYAGLLQTSFIMSYMVLSPIFGYLGDRYNRKLLLICGIVFWSSITLVSSFIGRKYFVAFIIMRGLVGVGEASYSTIAPTIIADLFIKDQRTKALSIFYFAIPIGSGLGYIVGAQVAHLFGSWQWALRVTPVLGLFCVILIVFGMREPARGQLEGGQHGVSTSYCTDVKALAKNKSFILSSLGFTCVAFIAGALSFWAPKFMFYSILSQNSQTQQSQVSLIFGVITCLAGFFGVGFGSEFARRLRPYTKRADPLVCAFGMLACAPFLFLSIVLANHSTITTWIFIFIGETFLCLNWALVADMVLYVVAPGRRSTAEALQILMSHALGDASSPYLVGLISDSFKKPGVESVAYEFVGLQSALYVTCFITVLGGGFFLFTSLFIVQDKARVDKLTQCTSTESLVSQSSNDANGKLPSSEFPSINHTPVSI